MLIEPLSSSGLGYLVLIQKITGSNPVRGTCHHGNWDLAPHVVENCDIITHYLMTYIDQPCERCGSKKIISKTWIEKLETMKGVSVLEISQIICTDKLCQELFDKNREEELAKINERKLAKEVQDKIRRENIARTIIERRKARMI